MKHSKHLSFRINPTPNHSCAFLVVAFLLCVSPYVPPAVIAAALNDDWSKTTLAEVRQAVEAGNPDAQFELGARYLVGNGVEKNLIETIALFTKAAEGGVVKAMYNLGAIYVNGHGTAKNVTEAKKWFYRAAERDDASSQYSLGVCLDAEKRFSEAAALYLKAAEQGHRDAQMNLAIDYYTGQGVEKSIPESAKWWRKAAELGDDKAALNLGKLYSGGDAVPKDDVEAARWFLISTALGNKEAEESALGITKWRLTKEQAQAAMKDAKAFVMEHVNAMAREKAKRARVEDVPRQVGDQQSTVTSVKPISLVQVVNNAGTTTVTIGSDTYEDIRWGEATPTSVKIYHRSGIANIPLEELPPELQRKFNFDPEKKTSRSAAVKVDQQDVTQTQRPAVKEVLIDYSLRGVSWGPRPEDFSFDRIKWGETEKSFRAKMPSAHAIDSYTYLLKNDAFQNTFVFTNGILSAIYVQALSGEHNNSKMYSASQITEDLTGRFGKPVILPSGQQTWVTSGNDKGFFLIGSSVPPAICFVDSTPMKTAARAVAKMADTRPTQANPVARNEFTSRLTGKTPEAVLAYAGRPIKTMSSSNGNEETWFYQQITYDPVSGNADYLISVFFKNNRVVKLMY